jgi:hypothetical protein
MTLQASAPMSFGHARCDRWGYQRREPKYRDVGGGVIEHMKTKQRYSRNVNHGNAWGEHPCKCQACVE